jgi:hypothetical protein
VGGSGTANFIPIWTDSSDLGDSVLYQTGSGTSVKVGIGTTTPSEILHVNGSSEVLSTGGGAGFKFQDRNAPTNAEYAVWYSLDGITRLWRSDLNDGSDAMSVALNSGNALAYVGINTDSPAYALDVNGNGIRSLGTYAALYFQMRDSTVDSAWYGFDAVSRFWRSDVTTNTGAVPGDVIGVSDNGVPGIGTTSSPDNVLMALAGH